jgi:hypothetical protein
MCRYNSTNFNGSFNEDGYRNNVEKELLNSRMAVSILSILKEDGSFKYKQERLENF